MAYSNYGIDPAMMNDADQIFRMVVDQLFNQGTIQEGQRQQLWGQYQNLRGAILNNITNTAQQAGTQVSREAIQSAIHQFISNSLTTARPMYGAPSPMYGQPTPMYGQPAPMYGATAYGGQPTYGGYVGGGYQPGTLYRNPVWHGEAQAAQAAYGRYAVPAAGGTYGGYVAGPTTPQTIIDTVNANRFASMPTAQVAGSAPVPQQSAFSQRTAPAVMNTKIDYQEPCVLEEVDVANKLFKGKSATLFEGPERTIATLIGSLEKPVSCFKDFARRMKSMVAQKLFFCMANTSIPVTLNAKSVEVNTILSKIGAIITAEQQVKGNGLEKVKEIFNKFYVEFNKESGDAHKAITKFLIDEFNTTAAGGYLFADMRDKIRIDSLDDILECFNEKTTSKAIQDWQTGRDYFKNLAALVSRTIFSIFIGRYGYRVLQMNSKDDQSLLATVFADLSTDDIAVRDGFFALSKVINSATSDINTTTAIKALYANIQERTVIMAPRTLIYTNLAPAGLITGDYANVYVGREVSTPTSTLESLLKKGYEALNNAKTVIAVNGVLESNSAAYGIAVGSSVNGNLVIKPNPGKIMEH